MRYLTPIEEKEPADEGPRRQGEALLVAALPPRDRLLREEAALHQILDILLPEGARRPCLRGRRHVTGAPRRGAGRLWRVAGHFEWWRADWIYESTERTTDGEETRRREQEGKEMGSPHGPGPSSFKEARTRVQQQPRRKHRIRIDFPKTARVVLGKDRAPQW